MSDSEEKLPKKIPPRFGMSNDFGICKLGFYPLTQDASFSPDAGNHGK